MDDLAFTLLCFAAGVLIGLLIGLGDDDDE